MAARTAERESARELAGLKARAETLAEAARRGADASAALLADPVRFAGVLGPFAERLHVAEGFEVAIAAALGAAADAVAVDGLDAAAEILAALRRHDAGSARLVIATPSSPADPCPRRPRRSHRSRHTGHLSLTGHRSICIPGRPSGPGPRGRPGAGAG